MTWITDNTGRRWVDVPERKRRKPGRALRFADLKVGDQLRRDYAHILASGRTVRWYYLVTDLWFDPVAGQDDEVAGRMVGIAHIDGRGDTNRKETHTLRGLASQGFHYAELDYIALAKAAIAGIAEGKVVGIGRGRVIRQRPKLPTSIL